jgi:hypothetical protein
MSKLLIGMVHLPALPGAPAWTEDIAAIEAQALEEARALHAAGLDGCVIENFGDRPFHKDRVEPITIACMARIATTVCRALPGWRVGVNVLRNDARAALSIAAASGARFVRVNVHVGATATDQGIVEGRAAKTLRLRRALGRSIEIWADVHVKHGRSLSHADIVAEAEDAVLRGGADALLVSGSGTGRPVDREELRRVVDARLGVPVLVASGVTSETVTEILHLADGVVVGTDLKRGGQTTAPLDLERARRFVQAVHGTR